MEKAELFRRRREGQTYAKIAAAAGVSRQRIQQMLSPPPVIQNLIIGRQEGKCKDCGIDSWRGGHIHHIAIDHEDIEDYGDIDNLVLLCPGCHRRRHALPPEVKEQRARDRRLDDAQAKANLQSDIQELLATARAGNWSDTAIGEELGVTGVTVWRWRNGQRTVPTAPVVKRVLQEMLT